MTVGVFGPESAAACHWPADMHRSYFSTLMQANLQDYIANVNTRLRLLQVKQLLFPLTVNDLEYENSYVCSPYTGAVSYPLDELWEIKNRPLRLALAALIRSLALPLRMAKINRAVVVNNWLLSTNLYPEWRGDEVPELTDCLVAEYPTHAILWRSLNRVTHAALCDRLQQSGYLLAPSRQVYIISDPSGAHLKKVDCKRDLRLLERETDYTLVTHDALLGSEERIQWLYDQLYLKKYSYHNPQLTSRLFRLWLEQRVVQFRGLMSKTGSLDGVAGYWSRAGVLTSPVVGYDTSLPRERGLYRMLAALVMREAWRTGQMLHMSAGVARFKRLRGATPHVEYTAVYCRHLPRLRRNAWRMLSAALNHIGAPLLKRYEL